MSTLTNSQSIPSRFSAKGLVFENIDDTYDEWAEMMSIKAESRAIRLEREELRRLKTQTI